VFINEIQLKNFRGLDNIELNFDEHINLLVGINGVGKSSVLEAMGILFSTFTNRIKGNYKNTRYFINDDIKNDRDNLSANIQLSFQGQSIKWSLNRFKKDEFPGRSQSSDFKSLNKIIKPLSLKLLDEQQKGNLLTSAPLVAYYGVNRVFKGKSNKEFSTTKINYSQLDAYDRSLSIGGVTFQELNNWFGYRQKFLDSRSFTHSSSTDSQLRSVENAITTFLPEFSNLSYDVKNNELFICKQNEELKLKQLSDGELSLIALIADIARRLAIANPALDNPLQGDAIILIDEIDLHLHPGWQRKLIANFQRTFPNTQFIFSTHSPQMIGHVEPNQMWLFKRVNKEVVAYRPEKSLGMDSNSILLQHLDVDEREPDTKNELNKLFIHIEENELKQAETLINELINKCGNIDELRRAKAIIKRKKLMGL